MLTNLNVTDMETGYKVFWKEILDQFTIQEDRFGIEPEITAKIAKIKPKIRIFVVGISYYGRTYEEGKKITWKDPQEHALAFVTDIARAKNVTETTTALVQPIANLETAESKLSKVNSDLSGPRKFKITAEILQQDGLRIITNIQRYIAEISKKVNKSGRK